MTNCVNTNNMQVPYDRLRFIPTPNDIDFSSGFEDLLRKSSLKIDVGTSVVSGRRFSHGTFLTHSGKTVVGDECETIKEGTPGVVTHVDENGDRRVKFEGHKGEQWSLGSNLMELMPQFSADESLKKQRRQSQVYIGQSIKKHVFLRHIHRRRADEIMNAARVAIHAANYAICVTVQASKVVVAQTRKLLKSCSEFSSVGLAELTFAQIVRFTMMHSLNSF